MSNRNKLLEQILLQIGGAPVTLNIDRQRNIVYSFNEPVINQEYDSGYTPNIVGLTEVAFVAIVEEAGNDYALFNEVSNIALLENPDIRVSQASEFGQANGDLNFSFWLDSTTNTVHYSIDTDGAIRTVKAIQGVETTLTITTGA